MKLCKYTMTVFLLVILILLLLGGVPAFRAGTVSMGNLLGIVLTVVIILLLFGLLLPPLHYYSYW